MLRRRRIADDGAPTLSTIVRTVHAALIGGPHLTRFDTGAEQRCDWLGGSGQPSRTRSQRSRVSRRYNRASDPPATYAVYGPDDADTTTASGCPDQSLCCASSRPRHPCSASATLRRHRRSRDIRRRQRRAGYLGRWDERRARACPRGRRRRVTPDAAAIDGGHEGASFDCNPESFRYERVAPDPANVMRVRSRRKRPFRGRRQCLQWARLLPRSTSVRRTPHFARFRARPDDVALDRARGDGHNQPAGETD
jgi:hypothetical protein